MADKVENTTMHNTDVCTHKIKLAIKTDKAEQALIQAVKELTLNTAHICVEVLEHITAMVNSICVFEEGKECNVNNDCIFATQKKI